MTVSFAIRDRSIMSDGDQMVPKRRRPAHGQQPSFPLTSVELERDRNAWKKRAEVAEKKLEDIEEALDKALCSVLGHTKFQYDYGSYCDRCGENT